MTHDTGERMTRPGRFTDLPQAAARDAGAALEALLADMFALYLRYGNVATTGPLEGWIDEAEQRTWFLHEVRISRRRPAAECRDPIIIF